MDNHFIVSIYILNVLQKQIEMFELGNNRDNHYQDSSQT